MRNCCKCRELIYDRVCLYMDDKFWHVNCLSCDRCQGVLANSGASCFFKNGMILCKSDYYRLSPTCFNCNLLVTPDSFVHKIPCLPIQNSLNDRPYIYYHPACLRCWKCQNFLRKGDKYIIKPDNMGIVCLNNECASDFRISPINTSINQPAPASTGRKRGRQSGSSVKVKNEKAQNQFNPM